VVYSCFVELGRYLCEVRAGQYWRLENLKFFDEFLERRFPESRSESLLLDVHTRASATAGKKGAEELREVGWTKELDLAKLSRAQGQQFDCAAGGAETGIPGAGKPKSFLSNCPRSDVTVCKDAKKKRPAGWFSCWSFSSHRRGFTVLGDRTHLSFLLPE
jgi:hypothetical protein